MKMAGAAFGPDNGPGAVYRALFGCAQAASGQRAAACESLTLAIRTMEAGKDVDPIDRGFARLALGCLDGDPVRKGDSRAAPERFGPTGRQRRAVVEGWLSCEAD